MNTDYFEARWYQQADSCHLYPTNRQIIDRLNRMDGKNRQWIPTPMTTQPPKLFGNITIRLRKLPMQWCCLLFAGASLRVLKLTMRTALLASKPGLIFLQLARMTPTAQ
ncbi:hypothetical protein A1359_15880 [Methylomonas lenta]|uniref:Uncharacterized protein n=1 Tax=Methylomonas lenta TaxID=980561 RepID=A0A177MYG5_9GAMM|nr:hypothetical protein A1359_15880 [Methylomonas lenta]